MNNLISQVIILGTALVRWDGRDETGPDAAGRLAANAAMDAIDAMLAELHVTRARLAAEIRQADDATAARVDAMLASSPAGPEYSQPEGR